MKYKWTSPGWRLKMQRQHFMSLYSAEGLIIQPWKVNQSSNNFLLHLNAGQVGSKLVQCYKVHATRCFTSYVCLHVFDWRTHTMFSQPKCFLRSLYEGNPAEPKSEEAWAYAALPLLVWKLPEATLTIQNWNVLYRNGLSVIAIALKLTENHEGRGVYRFFRSVGFISYVCVLQAQRWTVIHHCHM